MSTKRPKLLLPHHHHQHHGKLHQNEQQHQQQEQQQLIPGLPDHIAQLCLSRIHPTNLYRVCPVWRNFIYSPLFPPFLSLYAIFTPASSPSSHLPTPLHFSAYDPFSSRWFTLPPPADPPLLLLPRHPSFISRNLPIQSVSAGDKLVVVAATAQHLLPALPRPLVFTPLARADHWSFGPDIAVPRRWCAAGVLGGSVYLASGVGSHFSGDTARSVEKWDVRGKDGSDSCWVKTRPLHDGRFSRDAVDAVGWKGRLCMVNVKGHAPKQGAVYNAARDEWRDMAEGMVSGWRGPAAAMDEEVVYGVDESKGVLRRYDEVRDVWVDVLEDERLRGAHQMAARGGRVCVVCSDGSEIVVVDVTAVPAKMWVVEPPNGFNAVAVHVLPRMCKMEFEEL